MEVQLFVYDLTRGMARLMSRGLLGIQLDAVYHTSLVFGGVEYFFGAGVQTCYPGSTHHGQPMEIVKMGTTELPLEDILAYLESLKDVYSHESYDLFTHNCNNFTNDFAMFLVGKGIPAHITSLPETVLATPLGPMIKAQLDQTMRSVTQAAVPPENNPTIQAQRASQNRHASAAQSKHPLPAQTNGHRADSTTAQQKPNSKTQGAAAAAAARPAQAPHHEPAEAKKHPKKLEVRSATAQSKKQPKKLEVRTFGTVQNVTQTPLLDNLLSSAKDICAVVFFTSSTCAPCKVAYPTYDTLAAENPKVPFIKVDINQAHDIAMKYSIRVTPTFMTFLRGQKHDEWTGANPSQLRTNVDMLVQQIGHPHTRVKVPTLQFGSLKAITYSKIPPLDKLTAKMGAKASDPAVVALKKFISERTSGGAREAPLPDLPMCARFLRNAPSLLPVDNLFTVYDLLRCALLDARVSGWFVEESAPGDSETITFLLSHVLSHIEDDTCPYNLRLVTIQLACNLFSTSLFVKTVMNPEHPSHIPVLLAQLSTSSLLSTPDKPALRAAAGALAFNIATANYRIRREHDHEALPEDEQVALAASVLEMLTNDSSLPASSATAATAAAAANSATANSDGARPALLAFGYLIFCAPREGGLHDLCSAMDARGAVLALKAKGAGAEFDKLVLEIADGLLGGKVGW
ncbi:hypothetical protein MBLNU459_g4711t1 [Dothideomycetes sp. NU459]